MEIERKFLVDLKNIPYDLSSYPQTDMTQAYISVDPVIRIRKENDKYVLAMKGKGDLAREEHELFITEQQYNNLLTLRMKNSTPISKKRTSIIVENNFVYEIDEYFGLLLGLATVEVEFPSIDAANCFIAPDWFGREVTYDRNYGNSTMSIKGLPQNFSK